MKRMKSKVAKKIKEKEMAMKGVKSIVA